MITSLPSARVLFTSGALILLLFLSTTDRGIAQPEFRSINEGLDRATITCFGFTADGRTLLGTPIGIYRYDAGNREWTALDLKRTVHTIEQTPTGTLLAGTDFGTYRSTDNGDTWDNVYNIPGMGHYCFPADSTVFSTDIVGSAFYHYMSKDDGQTWSTLEIPQNTGLGTALAANSKGMLFYNSTSAIVYSSDLGKTWQSTNIGQILKTVAVTTNDVVVAVRFGFDNRDIILESSDDGASWSPVDTAAGRIARLVPGSDGSYYFTVLDTLDGLSNYNAYPQLANGVYRRVPGEAESARVFDATYPMAVRFDGPTDWIGANFTPFMADDTPEKWTAVPGNLKNITITNLLSDGTSALYALTPDDMPDSIPILSHKLYRSTDLGESWDYMAKGLNGKSLTVDGFGSLYAIRDSGTWEQNENNKWQAKPIKSLLQSTDGGATWEMLAHTVDKDIAWNTASGTVAIAVDGDVLVSRDKGATWARLSETIWQDSQDVRYVKQLAVMNDSSILMGVPRNYRNQARQDERGMYRLSPDNSFYKVIDGLYPQDLLVTANGIVYASANFLENNAPLDGGIYRSADNGTDWEMRHAIYLPPTSLQALSDTYLMGTGESQTFISSDSGRTWSEAVRNVGGLSLVINTAFVGPAEVLYGTSNYSILASGDEGKTWSGSSFRGLRGSVSTPLVTLGDRAFAGTFDYGMYVTTEPVSSAPGIAQGLATAASINVAVLPGATEVLVRIQLPAAEEVSFALYDILGRKAVALGSWDLEAGEHRKVFALPADLPKGTFFVVMESSSGRVSHPVQLP